MLIFNNMNELLQYIESGKKLPENFVYQKSTYSLDSENDNLARYVDMFGEEEFYIDYNQNYVELNDILEDDEIDIY